MDLCLSKTLYVVTTYKFNIENFNLVIMNFKLAITMQIQLLSIIIGKVYGIRVHNVNVEIIFNTNNDFKIHDNN